MLQLPSVMEESRQACHSAKGETVANTQTLRPVCPAISPDATVKARYKQHLPPFLVPYKTCWPKPVAVSQRYKLDLGNFQVNSMGAWRNGSGKHTLTRLA